MVHPPELGSRRPGSRHPWRYTTWAAFAAMVTSAIVGAWLTGRAVQDGDVTATIVRFGTASVFGAYYLVLYRTAKKQRPAPPPRRPRGGHWLPSVASSDVTENRPGAMSNPVNSR